MRKLFFSCICLFFFNYCFGQNFNINGKIKDSETNKPLPYATIQLNSLKTGTIADINGNFSLNVESNDSTLDTIEFSYLGYNKTKVCLSNYLKSAKIIELKEKPIELDEVKIIPKTYSTRIIGIKDKKSDGVQYANVFGGNKGNYIKNELNVIGWIKSVSYFLQPDGYPTCPFRIRIYEVGESGKPGKDLLKENVIVSAQKSGWFKIDISNYSVPFPKDGVFLMMEWINSGDEYYFEKEVTVRNRNGLTETVKRKYYGQSLGTVSKKSGVAMWGSTLGNEWIPYEFNNGNNFVNAMMNAEIAYEKQK